MEFQEQSSFAILLVTGVKECL